jgi:DNA-binding transcriptional LysR family regulator
VRWNDRIGRRLKLRDLHIFLTVAQQGSMGKAAKHLSVSQPVISKAIIDMEHMLKVRLLDRTAHGAEPTLYGRALLKWGVVVFDDLRQGVKEIEFLADPTIGALRLGAGLAMPAGLVPAVMDRISRRHPRITFQVIELPTIVTQYRDLRERNVELIVGRMPRLVADDDINAEILFHEKIHIVAGMKNHWIRRRKITLAELMNEPWCLPPGDTVPGSLVAEAFQSSGLDVPPASVTSYSLQLLTGMVATGRYLSICPTSVLHFAADRLGIKALPIHFDQQRSWPVAISTLKKRTVSPVAQLFIDYARMLAKPLQTPTINDQQIFRRMRAR